MAIYIHDEAAQLRLRVTGDLDDLAARELASCWTTALSVVGGRSIVVDLTGLASVAQTGRDFLGTLHQHGVQFLARSDFQAGLVAGVTGAGPLHDAPPAIGDRLKKMFGVRR